MYKIFPILSLLIFSCDSNIDCAGIENGLAVKDDCGICDNDPANDCIIGCRIAVACNFDSTATHDNESCFYAQPNYDCDGNCIEDIDCNNVCGGSAKIDCSGNCGGNSTLDICGVCNGDNLSCNPLVGSWELMSESEVINTTFSGEMMNEQECLWLNNAYDNYIWENNQCILLEMPNGITGYLNILLKDDYTMLLTRNYSLNSSYESYTQSGVWENTETELNLYPDDSEHNPIGGDYLITDNYETLELYINIGDLTGITAIFSRQ